MPYPRCLAYHSGGRCKLKAGHSWPHRFAKKSKGQLKRCPNTKEMEMDSPQCLKMISHTGRCIYAEKADHPRRPRSELAPEERCGKMHIDGHKFCHRKKGHAGWHWYSDQYSTTGEAIQGVISNLSKKLERHYESSTDQTPIGPATPLPVFADCPPEGPCEVTTGACAYHEEMEKLRRDNETARALWRFWCSVDITENDELWANFTNAVHAMLEGHPVPEKFLKEK